MVVIGAGAGGLVTAAGCSIMGARVALIERSLLGGDCLNTGCVPSKAFIKSAQIAHQIRESSKFGINVTNFVVDFPKIMERVRKIRADISKEDSVWKFSKTYGVDIYLGHASFISKNQVQVNQQTLTFDKCTIATGGRPRIPEIQGLETIPFYTSENIWNITEQPQTICFIGSGPISCELAQAFQRLGSQSYIISKSQHLLEKEDEEVQNVIDTIFQQEGVIIHRNSIVQNVQLMQATTSNSYPLIRVNLLKEGQNLILEVNMLFIAVGRVPNIENMNLEVAGVAINAAGISVNSQLQTNNKNIYAVGDVCTPYKFTHMADAMAKIVIRNSLFMSRVKWVDLKLSWCIFTDPEVANTGMTEKELQRKNIPYKVFHKHFHEVDKAICESNTEGFVKVFVKEKNDEILGATIIGPHAGDLISEISVALKNGIGFTKIGEVIHPYPTNADAIRLCAGNYNKTRLTPQVKKLVRKLLEIRF